jgi:tetratricopeptide (TPR) repeat protein
MTASTYTSISQALRAHDWVAVDRMYSVREVKGLQLSEHDFLRWSLARLHLGDGLDQAGIPESVQDSISRSLLIRYGVQPLRQAGRIKLATDLQQRIERQGKNQTTDGLRLLSALTVQQDWLAAQDLVEKLTDEAPHDSRVQQAHLRILIRSGEKGKALVLARQLLHWANDTDWARLLLPLMAGSPCADDREWAMAELDRLDLMSATWRDTAMRAYANIGQHHRVLQLAEQLKGQELLTDAMRVIIARSLLAQGWTSEHRQAALPHLRAAHAHKPGNESVAGILADALMREGLTSEALRVLESTWIDKPMPPYQRALYARALRQDGRFDQACEQFRILQEAQPTSTKWPRYLAATLVLAGRRGQAQQVFSDHLQTRREHLAQDFEAGLQALWSRLSEARIPQARLDWAWEMRDPQRPSVRQAWEARARWGHLADEYLLDWLECRSDLAEQAMSRLANLDRAEAFFELDKTGDKPWMLATAHVGPMYAGPLALALLGLKVKWLASTPGLLEGTYSESLISTTAMTETEVARQSLQALRQGFWLTVALDGALNLAAPSVSFEGQQITYSNFGARLVHKMNLPSAFVSPMWRGREIDFYLARLPAPAAGENVEQFVRRWQTAYMAHLRQYLMGEPENLRLSGGLWRHIRSIKAVA